LHKIYFHSNVRGQKPVLDYISELGDRSDKNSRIKFGKIQRCLQALAIHGTHVGEPYVKHLSGDIWELRPLKDRILFAAWVDGSYIVLHHFVKKTQKTPAKEIEQAKNNLKEYKERKG